MVIKRISKNGGENELAADQTSHGKGQRRCIDTQVKPPKGEEGSRIEVPKARHQARLYRTDFSTVSSCILCFSSGGRRNCWSCPLRVRVV